MGSTAIGVSLSELHTSELAAHFSVYLSVHPSDKDKILYNTFSYMGCMSCILLFAIWKFEAVRSSVQSQQTVGQSVLTVGYVLNTHVRGPLMCSKSGG